MALGQRIVRLRKERNWNQKEFAHRLGISPRQLVRWELNQVVPRPTSIYRLAEVLEVPPEELTAEPDPDSIERIEDRELRELISYIPDLDPERLVAVKMLLRDVITCHQFNRFNSRKVVTG